MNGELISVIVPVYNVRDYLSRCVQSIQSQTYPNLEIILVDDGSADGSGELCDQFAEADPRIRVFHKENGGSSSARNVGIDKANGEFLGFVDSDDYIDPMMYERLYEAIIQYGTNVAQIGRDEITPEGELLPDICIPPKETMKIPVEDFFRELLMHRGDCSFCTKLIRKDTLVHSVMKGIREKKDSVDDGRKIDYFPLGILNEDFHLLIRILPDLGPVVSLPGHLYHVFYRVGSNSRTTNKEIFSRVFADCVDNADMVAEIVARKYPELSGEALRFGIYQRLEYLLHIPISQMQRKNQQYRKIVHYLRHNWLRGMRSGMLTKKNKLYHTLFAIIPKGIRRVHAVKMKCIKN